MDLTNKPRNGSVCVEAKNTTLIESKKENYTFLRQTANDPNLGCLFSNPLLKVQLFRGLYWSPPTKQTKHQKKPSNRRAGNRRAPSQPDSDRATPPPPAAPKSAPPEPGSFFGSPAGEWIGQAKLHSPLQWVWVKRAALLSREVCIKEHQKGNQWFLLWSFRCSCPFEILLGCLVQCFWVNHVDTMNKHKASGEALGMGMGQKAGPPFWGFLWCKGKPKGKPFCHFGVPLFGYGSKYNHLGHPQVFVFGSICQGNPFGSLGAFDRPGRNPSDQSTGQTISRNSGSEHPWGALVFFFFSPQLGRSPSRTFTANAKKHMCKRPEGPCGPHQGPAMANKWSS